MDFALNEHQRDVQRRAREYAVSTVAPVASELDRKGRCPADILAGVADLGLLGGESDFVAYVAGLVELSKAWASLGAIVAVHNSLVCHPISHFGSDAQKKKYLPLLTEQTHLGCYAFAEPLAGSDAGAIGTTAVLVGDAYVLNGHKQFVTSGRHARVSLVYALTDPSKGRDGLSAFIVDTDTPGFMVGESNDMLGLRATETVDLLLNNCRVPKENLLGKLNQGFAIARAIVESGRIDIAAQAVGIGEACLEQSIAKAKSRRQFGRPIAEFEAIQWMVADMSTEIDASRLLMFRAAAMRAKNREDARLTMAASMAKLFASEAANRAAYNALQIFGGHGYLTEYPVERLFRDARAMTLYEETSEIQRLVIERELAR
ncbi:MAG TPA: acyl-CoA dehydrogenase family protein [Vicinamibacterales bacterium]|nr:acyl-CoA dehydrogenase family protein [Vicinamibacterales bacterium]